MRKKLESKGQEHARRARSRGKSNELESKTPEASCKKQEAKARKTWKQATASKTWQQARDGRKNA